MRIWTVPFGELDDKRVLGQHREIHMWQAMQVHACEDDQRLAYIVHDTIVYEMRVRGFTGHWTPMPRPSGGAGQGQDGPGRFEPPLYTSEQQSRDRKDLLWRWQGVYRGRITMPEAYEPLLAEYALIGSCQHDGRTQKMRTGDRLCLLCKRAIIPAGDTQWKEMNKWLE